MSVAERLLHIKEEFKEFIGDGAGTRMVIESCRDWSKTYDAQLNDLTNRLEARVEPLSSIEALKRRVDTYHPMSIVR